MADKIGWGWSKSPQLWVNIRNNHGIAKQQWQALWDRQSGRCPGCAEEFAHPDRKELRVGLKPQIDHVGDRVHGLVCRDCSEALARLRKDPAVVERLLAYERNPA